MPKKTRTLDQIRTLQEKAVRFLRDVVGDPEKADEFEALSPEEYAEHKRIEIKNPFSVGAQHHSRRITMATTRQKLEERIEELEAENENLQDKLDSILDIAQEEEEEENGGD